MLFLEELEQCQQVILVFFQHEICADKKRKESTDLRGKDRVWSKEMVQSQF
jgi:hypothetical protein